MEDLQALAKLYHLTIKPFESVRMFQQRIERHKKKLAESLKIGSNNECNKVPSDDNAS